MTAVSSVAIREHEYDKVKTENDGTGQQVARFPDRLRGFCSINPLKDYALDEIGRCARDPRLRHGLKLHFGNSAIDCHNSDHVAPTRRVFRAANDHRMAIIVHMRASISRNIPYARDEAQIFLNEFVAAASNVPIQIAHLAGAGGYAEPRVDRALSVFVEAIEKGDVRTRHLYFDDWRSSRSSVPIVRACRSQSDSWLVAQRLETRHQW